jgi:hypothetical protein
VSLFNSLEASIGAANVTAFDPETTTTAKFSDVDGRPVTVRPVYDRGLGRNLVELTANGTTVRLSNGIIPSFSDTVIQAAFLGEVENHAKGVPTRLGE